ncbi:MAG TPA: M15 family metallopeptidase, partial [Hymenobacter sp.]
MAEDSAQDIAQQSPPESVQITEAKPPVQMPAVARASQTIEIAAPQIETVFTLGELPISTTETLPQSLIAPVAPNEQSAPIIEESNKVEIILPKPKPKIQPPPPIKKAPEARPIQVDIDVDVDVTQALRKGPDIKRMLMRKYSRSGELSASELRGLGKDFPRDKLYPDAAEAFKPLAAAYKKHFGRKIVILDSYRPYREQLIVFKQSRPGYAAKPGKSEHGWGLALDLNGGIQNNGTRQNDWMREHGPKYGWENPPWAQPNADGPLEPWHWEFVGGIRLPKPNTVAPAKPRPTIILPKPITESKPAPAKPEPPKALIDIVAPETPEIDVPSEENDESFAGFGAAPIEAPSLILPAAMITVETPPEPASKPSETDFGFGGEIQLTPTIELAPVAPAPPEKVE